ncbi:hypothetical protein ANCCAN_23119 [Ancylostoma caninum]|uniref:Uncharacterized protein n=1 Tax=Ancylostoma caninum TaxID=29170 RepID=A0A368FHT8_ANCCA|nr:hypothetical protein ANCCAN_23119 [Ancylostoma caninum]
MKDPALSVLFTFFFQNKKNLSWINEEPQYTEFVPVGAKPYTLFKSIYTNNTNRPQEYSFKTERTTESLCSIAREQGYTMGAEAELTLKTPCTFVIRYYNFFFKSGDKMGQFTYWRTLV